MQGAKARGAGRPCGDPGALCHLPEARGNLPSAMGGARGRPPPPTASATLSFLLFPQESTADGKNHMLVDSSVCRGIFWGIRISNYLGNLEGDVGDTNQFIDRAGVGHWKMFCPRFASAVLVQSLRSASMEEQE